jgi:hypothetical protein
MRQQALSHWQICIRHLPKFRVTPVELSRKIRMPRRPEGRMRDGRKRSIQPVRQKSSVRALISGFPMPSLHKNWQKQEFDKLNGEEGFRATP